MGQRDRGGRRTKGNESTLDAGFWRGQLELFVHFLCIFFHVFRLAGGVLLLLRKQGQGGRTKKQLKVGISR